jgi:hypothetical protein
MIISPAMERDDPLDRIECRGSEGMPLTPLPSLGGFGQAVSQGQGQEGQDHADRPKMQETESSMPLLSRTPSGRIRRESGMSLVSLCSFFHSHTVSHLHLLASLLRVDRSPISYILPTKLTPSPNRRSNRNNLPTTRFRLFKRFLLRSNRPTNPKRNACE